MVAPDTVRRQLELLTEYATELDRLRELELDDYLAREAFAGRYLVQVAAQTCIDIANHVIASEGWPAPPDYRAAFGILAEHGAIGESLGERMKDLTGLRNRLVHVYGEIDDRLVFEALGEGLADLDEFARAIADLLR
jgi:uncharacterized protein YutE (UPF0331/DUF86 family)